MEELKTIKGTDIKKIIDLFKKQEFGTSKEDAENEYDVTKHKIFDETYRPDKIINKDTGNTDGNGKPITTKSIVPVERIGLPLQNQIVEQRIGFMLSNPVENNMTSTDKVNGKKLIESVESTLSKNRMYFRNKEILRRQMSEMECAELWYFVDNGEGQKPRYSFKCKILSPELGDELFPLKDEYSDMIAFGRGYKLKEDDKPVEHFDIYTKDFTYKFTKKDNDWKRSKLKDVNGKKIKNPIKNSIGKIPIIYHSQQDVEWANVQSMIQRLEDSISNHGDMNDYFGSPILAVSGEVIGFVQKGEGGKILELERDARANYLALNTPPESIKMEQEQLREYIYSLTNTADISFDKVKGIGNLSAVALQLLFISSSMAAKSKEESFSVGLQRRLNLIMAAIGKVIDTSLESAIPTVKTNPEITPYVPTDLIELLKMLAEAFDKGIISIEAVVESNPLIGDKMKELGLIIPKEKTDGEK